MTWECFELLFFLGLITELLGFPWICTLRHLCWKHVFKFLGTVFPRFLTKEVLDALEMKEFWAVTDFAI